MHFYLGTHRPHWLGLLDVPLFVSHRTLAGRKSFPRALAGWALDSGGFSELSLYGKWVTTPQQYAVAVRRYQDEIGHLEWCAPQDWMCEPFMLAKTGLSIREHQERTIHSYWHLAGLGLPVIPVLQGWTLEDYRYHVERYADYGVNLTAHKLVGLGSVCRRQATSEIARVVWSIQSLGIRLHGFGVKIRGLEAYHHALASADSLAWSFDARRAAPLPGHQTRHKSCSSCIDYAQRWRNDLLNRGVLSQLQLEHA